MPCLRRWRAWPWPHHSTNGWLGAPLQALFGIKVSFTWLGVAIAMVFISLPFVVRSVEPVLEALEHDQEEAAWCLGASPRQTLLKVVLPQLMPAILAGVAQGYSRAVGEYGSVVMISSNVPFRDLITPTLIIQKLEEYDFASATVIGMVMLLFSLLSLLVDQRPAGVGPQLGSQSGADRLTITILPTIPLATPFMTSQLRTVFNRLPRPSASVLIPLIACLYVGVIILLPALEVVAGAVPGLTPFIENFQTEELRSAVLLTLRCTLIAMPANTIFGLAAATAIARRQFPGKALLLSVIDLPFSISPVVVGLMLVLLYSPTNGLLGGIVSSLGWQIIFSWPGMALATIIVTFPFMAREVIPLLEEEGWDQEEAARTLGASNWQVFWKVTLPSVRWAVVYGLILTTARALGELAPWPW